MESSLNHCLIFITRNKNFIVLYDNFAKNENFCTHCTKFELFNCSQHRALQRAVYRELTKDPGNDSKAIFTGC